MIWELLGIMFRDIKERAAQQRGVASGWGLTPTRGHNPPESREPAVMWVPRRHPLQEELADAEDGAQVGLGSLEQTERGDQVPRAAPPQRGSARRLPPQAQVMGAVPSARTEGCINGIISAS